MSEPPRRPQPPVPPPTPRKPDVPGAARGEGERRPQPPASATPSVGAAPSSSAAMSATQKRRVSKVIIKPNDVEAAQKIANRQVQVPVKVDAPAPTNVIKKAPERIAAKKQHERRIKRNRWLKRLGIAAAIGLFVWALAASPLFRLHVEKIEIVGDGEYATSAQILSVIAEHQDESVFFISTRSIGQEVADLPAVASATVEVRFPDGLRVEVVEHLPLAAVPGNTEGEYILVPVDGTPMATVAEVPAGLPMIVTAAGVENSRVINNAVAVVKYLPEDLRAQVGQVAAATADSVELELLNGITVLWGSAENSQLKAEVLRMMLNEIDLTAVAVIDISAPERPVTRAAK